MAKTQRWAPEELLRTLVSAELEARDQSNARARLKAAGFPVTKTLEEFKVEVVVGALSHLRLPGQPGVGAGSREPLPDWTRRHGQVHLLVALGH